MNNQKIKEEDLKYIWHPCSQMKDYEKLPLIPIKNAKGVYLHDFDGNSYIDAISSWWVNLFGHSNPYINNALKRQVEELEHVIFAGFTHEPAIKLAKRLVELSPKYLTKVFFADNGSSAIEIAIKMSFHYFKNKNKLKPMVLSLKNSYHGETIGALSVGDVDLYKNTYDEILIKSIQVASPAITGEKEALEELEKILKIHHEKICSFIIEPLVQCAGSMKMYNANYIKEAKKLCEKYGVHLIADEIAVGFGRTGTLFACEQAEVSPDFMCLSKGLTGGYLPLSVVLTSDKIYNAFYCDYNEGKSFLHSHSYTGNTLACSVANAVLDIFENDSVITKNKELIELMSKELEMFFEFKNVKEIRQKGMIAAVELKGYDAKERIGLKIYEYALKKGVLIRPLGNVVYFMPPYVITPEELKKVFAVTRDAIKTILRDS